MESQSDLRNAVDQLLYIFQQGFEPFVVTAIKSIHGSLWLEVLRTTPDLRISTQQTPLHLDATALVRIMLYHWDSTFSRILTVTERSHLYEVRAIRNKWAHQSTINIDDVDRLADNITRLLTAINAANAPQSMQLRESMRELRYQRSDPPTQTNWVMWGVVIMAVVSVIGGGYWLTRPNTTETPPALPTNATFSDADAAPCNPGQIKANPRTMIYHLPDGAYYAVTKNNDIQCFDSVADVEAAGFRQAKR